jgi:hypothetical protein
MCTPAEDDTRIRSPCCPSLASSRPCTSHAVSYGVAWAISGGGSSFGNAASCICRVAGVLSCPAETEAQFPMHNRQYAIQADCAIQRRAFGLTKRLDNVLRNIALVYDNLRCQAVYLQRQLQQRPRAREVNELLCFARAAQLLVHLIHAPVSILLRRAKCERHGFRRLFLPRVAEFGVATGGGYGYAEHARSCAQRARQRVWHFCCIGLRCWLGGRGYIGRSGHRRRVGCTNCRRCVCWRLSGRHKDSSSSWQSRHKRCCLRKPFVAGALQLHRSHVVAATSILRVIETNTCCILRHRTTLRWRLRAVLAPRKAADVPADLEAHLPSFLVAGRPPDCALALVHAAIHSGCRRRSAQHQPGQCPPCHRADENV